MFHFQTLDVYKCAVGFLPRRFLIAARGSAFECAAALEALVAIGVADPRLVDGQALLESHLC